LDHAVQLLPKPKKEYTNCQYSGSSPQAHSANEAYKVHLEAMFLDRLVDSRLTDLSRRAFASKLTEPSLSVMTVAYDAMDQAKFAVPRGSPVGRGCRLPKDLAACWKPRLHVVACIIDGHVQSYHVSDANMPKNANMTLTVLARTLHVGSRLLVEPGTASETVGLPADLPLQLHIRSDNGSGDMKNQTAFKFAMWLVLRKAFVCVTFGQFRPGHAHFRADQSFSTCKAALEADNNILEDPSDFVNVLKRVRPAYGKHLLVERLDACRDWKAYFADWPVFSGHTQTKQQAERNQKAVHCFKFVLRRDLIADSDVESQFPEPAHPDDVVLLTKMYLGSLELSQAPVVAAPRSYLALLQVGGPRLVVPRDTFSKRMVLELQKSARVFSHEPYGMLRTKVYFEQLLAGENGEPPIDDWIHNPTREHSDCDGVLTQRPSAHSLDYSVGAAPVLVAPRPQQHAPHSAQQHPDADVRQPRAWLRRRLGPLPQDMRGTVLGCPKCKGKALGCSVCRPPAPP